MKTQQLLVVLTVANAALLTYSLTQPHRAAAENVAPVLRGRAFEIVDDHGRIRAEIKVLPAQPTFKMPDGTTGYPETVQLRLFNSKGESEAYAQILARGTNPFVKLVNKDGRQQSIKP
jgi:hypothetical protein